MGSWGGYSHCAPPPVPVLTAQTPRGRGGLIHHHHPGLKRWDKHPPPPRCRALPPLGDQPDPPSSSSTFLRFGGAWGARGARALTQGLFSPPQTARTPLPPLVPCPPAVLQDFGVQQLWHGEGAGGGAGLGEVMPWKLQQKQRSLGAANPVFAGRCCGSARGGGGGEHQGGGTSREGCERCFRQTPACSLVSSGRTSRQLPAPPPRCGLLSAPTGCDEFLGPQRCPRCRQGYDGGLHAHSLPGTGWGGGGGRRSPIPGQAGVTGEGGGLIQPV